jgi:hypothetical protein
MAHGYLGDGYGTHGEIDPDTGERDRRFMFGGDWNRPGERRRYSDDPDEHYRSWRDRHMAALDRDYRDYCIEREEQFHRDFDTWRREKYGNPQPLRTGMTQSGISHDPSGMTQASEDSAADEPRNSNPTATATLGTNSGRSRSRG